eukprot:gene10115-13596_t
MDILKSLYIVVAFGAQPAILALVRYYFQSKCSIDGKKRLKHTEQKFDMINDMNAVRSIIVNMERLIQMDEGNRGISDITLPIGELYQASEELSTSNKIAILTGFPCMIDYNPPTETDGPLGAVAIAVALLKMGKEVIILTDECNEEVLLAAVAASEYGNSHEEKKNKLSLESFPNAANFDSTDMIRLDSIYESIDLILTIERAGPTADGKYRTMRGRDMTHLIAPLDILLRNDSEDDNKRIRSIGIGDGGNEVGMGKVYDSVIKSKSIPNGDLIACTVSTDYLIVSSVSNWGGYALIAATAILWYIKNNNKFPIRFEELKKVVSSMLPSNEEEIRKCQRMVDSGARDGVTGKLGLFVDGMPLEKSLMIIEHLRNCCGEKQK